MALLVIHPVRLTNTAEVAEVAAMEVMVEMEALAHTSLVKPPIMAAMAVVEAMEVTDIHLPVRKGPVVVAEVMAEMLLARAAVAMVLLITAKAATVVKTARMVSA